MSARIRPRVERLERDVGHEEVWVLDRSERRRPDEPPTYQRVPVDLYREEGLSTEAFEQLPPNPRRILVIIENEGEDEEP